MADENRKVSESPLEITGEGTLVGGALFIRITNPANASCIEYQAGELAKQAGYSLGERVKYKVVILPKEQA